MKWNMIFSYLGNGGSIRRKSWHENEWVELGEEPLYSYPIILVDQDGEEVELLEEDLKADDWEKYEDNEVDPNELSYWTLLNRVTHKGETIHKYLSNHANALMVEYGTRDNSLSFVGDHRVRYYILYSFIINDYFIDEEYTTVAPTMVCFTNKKTPKRFIEENRQLLDNILKVDLIRNLVHNEETLNKGKLLQYDKDLDRLLKESNV